MQTKFLEMFRYKDITKLVKIISLLHLKDLHIHQLIKLSPCFTFQTSSWGMNFMETGLSWEFFFLFSCQFGLKSLLEVTVQHGSHPNCVSIPHTCHRGSGGRQKLFSCLNLCCRNYFILCLYEKSQS